jgi:IS30 family transposase
MRKYQQLSQEERYLISYFGVRRKSINFIARELSRSPSTICREIHRNRRTYDFGYRAQTAHNHTVAHRKRSRRGSHFTQEQWNQVIFLIKQDFSPEQAAAYLKIFGSFSISHETIYKFILTDKKQGGSLFKHLRIMPKLRRKRYNSHDSRGILQGKKHISQRPPEVETRSVLGHWEGDTVVGKGGHHCILTLVERKTGFVIIKKLTSRTKEQATKAAIEAILHHRACFKTITFDNGTEFHDYAVLEAHYPVQCYFATPYHSWERGTNENTNGLIRQYLPKRICMKAVSQAYCDWVAKRLNTRPRKRHGYKTPEEVYYAA